MKHISVIILVATLLMAAGCGQSKVEYKKDSGGGSTTETQDAEVAENEKAPETASTPTLAESVPPGEVVAKLDAETEAEAEEKAKAHAIAAEAAAQDFLPRPAVTEGDLIAALSLRSSMTEGFQHSWQKWSAARDSGLGATIAPDNIDQKYENIYTLRDVSKSRCVFRNRLLRKGTVIQDGEQLTCVPQTAQVSSTVKIAVFSTGDGYFTVRWVGTSGRHRIRVKGRTVVDMKMTARISNRQKFDGAAATALPDGMDVLLSTHLASMRVPDPTCALERTFDLKVTFNNGLPIEAKLVARTEQQYVMELERAIERDRREALPVPRSPRNRSLPLLKRNTLNACAYQHYAWAHCARATATDPYSPNCTAEVSEAVDVNFRALLDARLPGFGTDRVFLKTRDEANGEAGKLGLWYSPDYVVKGQMNPLSIEDFQQLTDIIELKLSRN